MDLKDIQELIKLISESNLTALELEKDGFKLVLKKEIPAGQNLIGQGVSGNGGHAYGNAGLNSSVAGELQPGQRQPLGQGQLQPQEPATQTVTAPIVGTFYAAPAPGEEPFVRPGSRVKPGDTLCIIEAMKLMNEIEAEEELVIIDVLVKDGQMVEYGQPLFAVSKP